MKPAQLTIPPQVARRFILGRQGLWPGRRWSGPAGTVQAMQSIEHLQLDPLNITARSQDLKLHARVAGYQPEQWQQPAYAERQFFDWGDWLAVRPMQELPYFRTQMRAVSRQPRHADWAAAHSGLLAEIRETVRLDGPVSNRDFTMDSRTRVNSYRGRKDSSLALFHLWRTGEIMTTDRNRFERIYDLTERVAPAELIYEEGEAATARYLLLKNIAFNGIRDAAGSFPVTGPVRAAEARKLLTELVGDGLVTEVTVEGWRGPHYLLTSDLPLLAELLQDRVPAEWQPLAETSLEAVTFLAPLEPVSARGRALKLFGFEYIWEVYKPVHKRRWGYYVLPILWGDELVARTDLKLDRSTNTLQVLGFWLEQPATGNNADFAEALGRGFANLQQFLSAAKLDLSPIRPVALRSAARKSAKAALD